MILGLNAFASSEMAISKSFVKLWDEICNSPDSWDSIAIESNTWDIIASPSTTWNIEPISPTSIKRC
tara:strand:- start:2161 stop:2361 length:201 start_codon:yes stop_codon:yes gene_type:complete